MNIEESILEMIDVSRRIEATLALLTLFKIRSMN